MTQLNRETRRPIFSALGVGLIGFIAGWLLFSAFGHSTVVVNTNRDPWAVPQSGPISGPDYTAQSTTKVDNIDIAGTTAAHGLVTLFSGITGLPTQTCGTNTVLTAFSTTGSSTCSAPPAFTSVLSGYAPASGGGTANYLRADGTWQTPPGTGVSSITAGQSITVTGTTTPTVALNFPTTACSAGQAVTSHNSAGTPSCSTFVNAAGTGLQLTGSSLAVNIAGASCSAGQFVSAISATGTGTCTAAAGSIAFSQGYLGTGEQGSLHFDGTTAVNGISPTTDATLPGSTKVYVMTDVINATDILVDSGVFVITNSPVLWTGTNTNNGLMGNPGHTPTGSGPGSGAGGTGVFSPTGGSAGGTGTVSANSAGTAGSDNGGAPRLWTTGAAGNAAVTGQGGRGGYSGTGANGGAITITSTRGWSTWNAYSGRDNGYGGGGQFTCGTGGGGGGVSSYTSGVAGGGGGGGGGGNGFFQGPYVAGSGVFTVRGGGGGAASYTGAAPAVEHGGGGGGGGYIVFQYSHGTGTWTVDANGGTGSAGLNGGNAGNNGHAGTAIRQNLSGDGT